MEDHLCKLEKNVLYAPQEDDNFLKRMLGLK